MTLPKLRIQQQQRSRLIAFIISPFVWLHALTVKPVVNFWLYIVLGAIEESISSLIREGLALTQRSVNGFSAWVLSGESCVQRYQQRRVLSAYSPPLRPILHFICSIQP